MPKPLVLFVKVNMFGTSSRGHWENGSRWILFLIQTIVRHLATGGTDAMKS